MILDLSKKYPNINKVHSLSTSVFSSLPPMALFLHGVFHTSSYTSTLHRRFFSASLPFSCTGSLSSVLSVDVERTEEGGGSRTRLIAQNIPWSYSGDDVRRIFQKHGVVDDVEVGIRVCSSI